MEIRSIGLNIHKLPGVRDEPYGGLSLFFSSFTATMSSSSTKDGEKLSAEVVTVEYATPAESVNHSKVLRKLDLHLIPPVCFLYLLCFL